MELDQQQQQPHAVLFPLPNSPGHLNPMLLLAKRLAMSGRLRITLVTPDNLLSSLSPRLLPGLARLGVRLLGVSDGFSHHNINGGYLRVVAANNMEAPMELLLNRLRPVACVIDDGFVLWMRDLLKRLGIPRIVFWPQPATLLSIYSHTGRIISTGYDPLASPVSSSSSSKPIGVDCLPGVPLLPITHLPFRLPTKTSIPWVRVGLSLITSMMEEGTYVVVNSFDELEPQVYKALQSLHPIGPLISSPFYWDEDHDSIVNDASLWEKEDCTQWLDDQDISSIVYVSFGTSIKFSITQIFQIALGLKASQQKFLWVIREDALIDEMKHTMDTLIKEVSNEVHSQGKVVRWVDQCNIISHRAVGGFFTHCGWNSMLESITMGVPILGWPHYGDQSTNCWLAINEWNIGVELERDEDNMATKEQIERGVRRLMEGKEAQERQRRATILCSIAKRALEMQDGSLNRNIHALINHIINYPVISTLETFEVSTDN